MLHSFYIWLALTFEFFAIRFLKDPDFSTDEKVDFICAHSAKKNSSSTKNEYPYILNYNFNNLIDHDILYQIMKSSSEATSKLVEFFKDLGPGDIASSAFCTRLGDHPEKGARRFVKILLHHYEGDKTENKTGFKAFINRCGLETQKGLATHLISFPCTSTAEPLLITLKAYFSPYFRSTYIEYWVCRTSFMSPEKCAEFFETNKAHFTEEELDFVTKGLAERAKRAPTLTKEDLDMGRQAYQFIEAKIDIYAELGVQQNAQDKEIKNAYKAKALLCHPDKNPAKDDKEFKQLNAMYKMVINSVARTIYDENYPKVKQSATDEPDNSTNNSPYPKT